MIDFNNVPKYNDLIYDIGMHKGEDTEFYLQKGFRVISVEADPELVNHSKSRLKRYIDQGKLIIIEGAIIDTGIVEKGHKIQFFKNNDISVWGTICKSWMERNICLGASSTIIEVETVNFAEMLRKYGIPYYMKIDIEGSDIVCLKTLRLFKERPNFISIESDKTSFEKIKYEINTLQELGYDRFQAIEQSSIELTQIPPKPAREGYYVNHNFEKGSSGLFGFELDKRWKTKQQILRQYFFIRIGYYLFGDNGVLNKWDFKGSVQLKSFVKSALSKLTREIVPGWYDTHAQHSGCMPKASDIFTCEMQCRYLQRKSR